MAKRLKADIALLRCNLDARLRPLLSLEPLPGPIPTGAAAAAAPSSPLQPPPAQLQHSQQEEQQQQLRSHTPHSYISTPYDEIPVGGGAGAAQARAAAYAASRGASSSSMDAPHHQIHHASDPVAVASSSSATAAGGEGGTAAMAAGGMSPRKAPGVFDEDAPIVGTYVFGVGVEQSQRLISHTIHPPNKIQHFQQWRPGPRWRADSVATRGPTPRSPPPRLPTPAGPTRGRAPTPWRGCRTTGSCPRRSRCHRGARSLGWSR